MLHDGTQSTPVGPRHRNVILFGETGVGKSSVINLIAGAEIAKTSPDLEGCTLASTEYKFNLSEEVPLRIFDTIGLEEPEMSTSSFLVAVQKAHQLITSLHDTGGVHLLLFCIKGGRVTTAMQRSYRLFFEILCESQVPLAIIITNLELEDDMENWWVRNKGTLQRYDIRSTAHACITSVPPKAEMHKEKRAESRDALRNMLLKTLRNPDLSYMIDKQNWFIVVLTKLRSLLTRRPPKQRDLAKTLERRCKFSPRDARNLAHVITQGKPEKVEI